MRKGDTATKDRWEYVSGLWKKWKLDVLLLPPALTSIQYFCFSPIYFFLSLCVSLHVSNSDNSSLCLNREDDKNLKPIPIWKGTLCQTPFPSVDVLGREVHGCADIDSSLLLFYSTTRNDLKFTGAQDHSPAEPKAMPPLWFCLLSHFSMVGPSTMGSCGSGVANTPNCLCSLSYCTPALWPSVQVVRTAHLKV